MDRAQEAARDLVRLAEIIEDGLRGIDRDAFMADRVLQDAAAFRLLHVGEDVKKLPADVRARFADVPWPSVTRMRDRLAHHYFGVDGAILWDSALDHLPALIIACRAILTDAEGSQ